MTGIDRDILITRVLDGEATPEDWAAFRAMAARDPVVWVDLTDAQQDRAELASAVAEAIAIADHIEAPIEIHVGERLNARIRTGVAWLGWAAAAVMAFGAFTGLPGLAGVGTGGSAQEAGLFRVNTPEDAMQLYLDKGQQAGSVLGEVPERVLLSSEPLADGRGYSVVYLRQIVECQRVEDLYQVARNEAGRAVSVPYTPKVTKKVTY
jgi:hypothetical protein